MVSVIDQWGFSIRSGRLVENGSTLVMMAMLVDGDGDFDGYGESDSGVPLDDSFRYVGASNLLGRGDDNKVCWNGGPDRGLA